MKMIAACLLMLAGPALGQSARQYVSTPSGTHLGYTIQQGRQKVAYSERGDRLGYYDGITDTTRDRSGTVIAHGDVTASLIVTR